MKELLSRDLGAHRLDGERCKRFAERAVIVSRGPVRWLAYRDDRMANEAVDRVQSDLGCELVRKPHISPATVNG